MGGKGNSSWETIMKEILKKALPFKGKFPLPFPFCPTQNWCENPKIFVWSPQMFPDRKMCPEIAPQSKLKLKTLKPLTPGLLKLLPSVKNKNLTLVPIPFKGRR